MRVLVFAAFSVVVAVIVSGASCGGKVVLDTPSTTGAGGFTGSAGTAGGSTGTFGVGGGGFGGANCKASGDPCNPSFTDECCSGTCDSSDQCL